MTAECLLTHRRLIMCKFATLGGVVSDKLAIGKNIKCEEKKLKIVEGYMDVLCTYNPDRTDNCLTEEEICLIIRHSYKLLPESCY